MADKYPLNNLVRTISATLRQMRVLPTDSNGDETFTDANPGKVDVKSSALPSGAATAAKQDEVKAVLDALDILLTSLDGKDFATSANQDIVITALANILAALAGTLTVDGSVAVTESALPTGAATQATLAAIQDKIIAAPATEAKQDTVITQLNITLSALRDAITAAGVDAKTLNDLYGRLDAIKTAVEGTQDVQLTGSTVEIDIGSVRGAGAEIESFQDSQSSAAVEEYLRAEGASMIELYLESGEIRVRTDGDPCTASTGIPLVKGDAVAFQVPSISVYYVAESTVTVVSR